MKKSILSPLIGIFLAAVISFSLISCGEDSSTNNSGGPAMSAKIKNALTLDFSTDLATLSKIVGGEYITRTAIGTVIKGSTTYNMTLTVYDKGSGKGTYNLAQLEGYAILAITTTNSVFYNFNVTGEITLTQCDDKNWVGSFHFDATTEDSTKLIEVYEGKLNIHK